MNTITTGTVVFLLVPIILLKDSKTVVGSSFNQESTLSPFISQKPFQPISAVFKQSLNQTVCVTCSCQSRAIIRLV